MDKEIFIKYFEGTITKDEEQSLLFWIDQNEENRRIFMQERQLWDMVILNYPENMNAIRSEPDKRFTGKKAMIELLKIAAIFVLALLISIYFISDRKEIIQAWNTIEVPIGQRTFLTLTDGTKVWLNAKTKLSFPDKFDKTNRIVKLDGEAVFDVTHNELPFIVETNKYKVKVLGTEFNVYAYSHSNTFEATLIRGKITIQQSNSNDTILELSPNHMASYNETSEKLELKPVNTQQSVYWREGIYSFENQSLASIFQRLERYYEVEFDVKKKKILDDSFTGKFRYRDPIEVILEVVKKSSRFKYVKTNNKITIY